MTWSAILTADSILGTDRPSSIWEANMQLAGHVFYIQWHRAVAVSMVAWTYQQESAIFSIQQTIGFML